MSDKINLLEEVAQLSENEKTALRTLLGIYVDTSGDKAIFTPQAPTDLADSAPSVNTDNHWGKRVIKVLERLDPETVNHPDYADPVAWVKKVRENNNSRNDSENEE
jgi:hypothetical protein